MTSSSLTTRRSASSLISLWVLAVLHGFSLASGNGIAAQVAQTFHVEFAQAASAVSFGFWPALLILPIAATGDRGGRKRPLIALSSLAALAAGAGAFAPRLALLHLSIQSAQVLGGAAAVLLLIVTVEAMAPDRSGLGVGIVLSGGALGAWLVTFARPFFDDAIGWQKILELSAATVPLILLVGLALPEPRKAGGPRRAIWRPLTQPAGRLFWPLLGAVALVATFTTVYVSALQAHLTDPGFWDAASLLTQITIAGVLGTIFGVAAGWGSDTAGRKVLANISLLIAASGGVLTYFAQTPTAASAGLILASIGLFSFATTNGVQRVELFAPELRSSALGWLAIGVAGGTAIGQELLHRDFAEMPVLVTLSAGGLVIALGALTALPETVTRPRGST